MTDQEIQDVLAERDRLRIDLALVALHRTEEYNRLEARQLADDLRLGSMAALRQRDDAVKLLKEALYHLGDPQVPDHNRWGTYRSEKDRRIMDLRLRANHLFSQIGSTL